MKHDRILKPPNVQLSPSEDLQEHIRDNHECSDMEEDKAEESFQLEDGIKDYVPISEKVDVDRSEESAQLIEESVPSTGVQYNQTTSNKSSFEALTNIVEVEELNLVLDESSSSLMGWNTDIFFLKRKRTYY